MKFLSKTTFILSPLAAKIEMGIYGQLQTKTFICDQFWGILSCFDNFREPYIVQAQKAPPRS